MVSQAKQPLPPPPPLPPLQEWPQVMLFDAMWSFLWPIMCIHPLVSGFNLDLRSAVIKPGPKGTMFGYTVALYRFNRERQSVIFA